MTADAAGGGAVYYNREEALSRLAGDEELFSSLVEMFVADHENYCHALEGALSLGDTSVLRREAHTIKGMLATFSCEAGRTLALQLEEMAASGRLDGAEALAAQVTAAVRQLAKALVPS